MPIQNRLNNHRHYELLIRLRGNNDELVLPGFFLPAAERYNLITRLDRWVIDQAIKTLRDHPNFLPADGFLSLNLSGQSLVDSKMLEFITTRLTEYGVDPTKLCFEITETAAIANLSQAISFINELHRLGSHFALDDFGSGLSSFGYLKNLKVDYLKIDGMFVKDIVNDPIDHAMVRSIYEIGKVMGIKTIAEYVENDEIKGMVREIGLEYAQGYAIGRPQPLEELLSASEVITFPRSHTDGIRNP